MWLPYAYIRILKAENLWICAFHSFKSFTKVLGKYAFLYIAVYVGLSHQKHMHTHMYIHTCHILVLCPPFWCPTIYVCTYGRNNKQTLSYCFLIDIIIIIMQSV